MPDASPLVPLSGADHRLIEAALTVIEANADDSGRHTVGAAVRDVDGGLHLGVNLAHFTGGPCAELVALATARANGARDLDVLVAVGRDGAVLAPCGRDRQILLDYHPDLSIILPFVPTPRKIAARALLPWGAPWSWETGTARIAYALPEDLADGPVASSD